MGRHASKHDFEGGDGRRCLALAPLSGALVERPTHLYDGYRDYPIFAQRADWIVEHYPEAKTVLVAGCGWGFLIKHLLKRKINAWGFDVSPYAVEQAGKHLPSRVADRVFLIDAGDADGVHGITLMAGTHRVDLVVTEDLLPYADDEAEARVWLENLRAVGLAVLHICTPTSPSRVVQGLNLTHAEWATFCAPDRVLCTECMRALP